MPDTPPDEPKSTFDRVITATPIVLTVVATIFAGLSGSEMNLAMYWRSVAAQDQSKAGSQWAFAGFKRDRSLILQGQTRTLLAAADRGPATAADFAPFAAGVPDADKAVAWLTGGGPPKPESAPRVPHPPGESGTRADVDDDIRAAEATADAFDKSNGPVLKAADALDRAALERRAGDRPTALAVQAARADLDHRRYLIEARLNQDLGRLHEVRVTLSEAESDRHRIKSKNFFYVMLVAQAGVTVASVALAQRKKSLFWVLASLAGAVAILCGVYVYLAI